MSGELVKPDAAAPAISQETSNILALIERVATNPEADIDKLERLLDMQERVLKRNAEQSFNAAMAEMQSDLPVIAKNGAIKVKDEVRSKYARYEDIMSTVKPILQRYGFAVTFRTKTGDGAVKVTGVLLHRDGHREETDMELPMDNSGSKNTVQAIGSSTSYGKRYVLCSLLNIATGDEDDDGQMADLSELAEAIRNLEACETMDDLAATFKAAWTSFPSSNDRKRLSAAKDDKKRMLS